VSPQRKLPKPICLVPRCDRPTDNTGAFGLCHAHYERWRRHHDDADLVTPINTGSRAPSATPWNPWAGKVTCPECKSSDWTMPYDKHRDPRWRCIECHVWFVPDHPDWVQPELPMGSA
jgi:hypothetical protein